MPSSNLTLARVNSTLERLKLMATEIHRIREGASKAHHVATCFIPKVLQISPQ